MVHYDDAAIWRRSSKKAANGRDSVLEPQSSPADPATSAGVGRWLVGAVVVLAALLNGATGLLTLVAPKAFLAVIGHDGEPLTAGTRALADYAGTRELALGVMLIVLLAVRAMRVLVAMLALAALVNLLDGATALAAGRWTQAPPAFVVALVFAVSARWLAKQQSHRTA